MSAAVESNCVLPRTQVAEQVMGLFKGALDFEKELAVFEQEVQKSRPSQTQHITPLKQNGHVVVRTSSSSDQQVR